MKPQRIDRDRMNKQQRIRRLCRRVLKPASPGRTIAFSTLMALMTLPSHADVVWRESLAHPADIFGMGNQANANSQISPIPSGCTRVVSDDGRFAVFESDASNLVRGDTNNQTDVFLRDTHTGQTRRISLASDGTQLGADSQHPCISADGRYVSYQSMANVTGETDHTESDIYLYDRVENSQRLVSRPGTSCSECVGDNRNAVISGDGLWIVFETDSLDLFTDPLLTIQIVRYERMTGQVEVVSVSSDDETGDSGSEHPSISDDGRFIAFQSLAGNLTADIDGFNYHVYLRDTVLGTTTLASKALDGTPGDNFSWYPTISNNGEYLAFTSRAGNLVTSDLNAEYDAFVYRVGFESIERVSVASNGTEASDGVRDFGNVHLSGDGNFATFISDSADLAGVTGPIDYTVFIHDRSNGETVPLGPVTNTASAGQYKRTAMLNIDGSIAWVATEQTDWLAGDSNGAVDIIQVDINSGSGTLISRPNRSLVAASGANAPSAGGGPGRRISADGRYVVFESEATNLQTAPFDYPADQQVFLLDRLTRQIELVAIGSSPSISSDGRYIAFSSYATDLVANDTNDESDIFVFDVMTDTMQRVSINTFGAEADDGSFTPSIAAGGRHVVFRSFATNLVSQTGLQDRNDYLHDLDTGETELLSVDSDGIPANGTPLSAPSVSADGRYVAFESSADNLVADDTNNEVDVFVRDRTLGVTRRVSVSTADEQADGGSHSPWLSDDGRVVVFTSDADNLTPDPATSSQQQYAHEITTGVTERVSVNNNGDAGDSGHSYLPVTNDDGQFVVWSTESTNLTATGNLTDSNGVRDLYLHDRDADLTRRISTDRLGQLGMRAITNGSERTVGSTIGTLSSDGRFVLVNSDFNDLHLDAGRYAQTDDINDYEAFLVELSGFAEATTISTIDLSTLNAEVGVPVTIPILVTGDATPPLDGVASIDADTGEVCLETDRMTVSGQPNARSFDCEITFRSQGDHQLSLGFSVSESHQSSALLATISVVRPTGDPNQPPVAESQTLTVTPDTPRMINLLASDPDGDPLTFALLSPPSSGSLAGTPPNITYTPDPGFTGQDSFVFGVSDGVDNSGPATITLIVSGAPVPIADSQTVNLDEDDSAMVTLSGSASDGGGPLDYMVSSEPSFGMLMGTPPSLIYEPDPNAFGVDSFQFVVIDSTGTSEPATVTLIVDPVNDPPSFTPGPDLAYAAGSVGVQTEISWATDISPGPLEMDSVAFTINVDSELIDAISMSADGTLEVTLSGIDGVTLVEVTAVDSQGGMSEPATFELSVGEVFFSTGFEVSMP